MAQPEFDFIPQQPIPYEQTISEGGRTLTQTYLPASIDSAALNIVQYPETIFTESISLGNNFEYWTMMTASATPPYDDKSLMLICETTAYMTSVAPANIIPTGSGVTFTGWTVIGPFNILLDPADTGNNANANYLMRSLMYVLNQTGSTKTVLIHKRVRRVVEYESGR